MLDSRKQSRSIRWGTLWVLSALLLVVYFALPGGGDDSLSDTPQTTAEPSGDPRKLEVLSVTPSDATVSSAIVVAFAGVQDEGTVRAYAGKTELPVLARRPGALVVRVPADTQMGRLKIRVGVGEERSKPYDIRIKAFGWQKPFRNLAGGFALLLFGIGMFARGVRETAGLRIAQWLGRVARHNLASLGLGALLGGFIQCTTAVAGFLAGMASSRLLAVGAAAAAFLGAQAGAAVAPLIASGLIDGRGGLIVIAIGMLWVGLASDRRGAALGQFLLGAGLIAFGLQTLRPGIEPFVSAPVLMPFVERMHAESIAGVAFCSLVGAVLVAALQGPVPVLMLVLVLAQTTGHWESRTALAVLSGSGLGAAVGALLTTPAGSRCRRLARVHLGLGLASTLIAASTIGIWDSLANSVLADVADVEWGSRVHLPGVGLKLGVAFAASQVASALVIAPFIGLLVGWIERRWPEKPVDEVIKPEIAPALVRSGLLRVIQMHLDSLECLSKLVQDGEREAGRSAEHKLTVSRAKLEDLLSIPARALPDTPEGANLGRAAFACLQLARALDSALRQGERLTDARVAALVGATNQVSFSDIDNATLREMHEIVTKGLSELTMNLEGHVKFDVEDVLAREIQLNQLEEKARSAVLGGQVEASSVRSHVQVLEMVDAYEIAGNQLCRLATALGAALASTSPETASHEGAVSELSVA